MVRRKQTFGYVVILPENGTIPRVAARLAQQSIVHYRVVCKLGEGGMGAV
jgi:hypothetical protein